MTKFILNYSIKNRNKISLFMRHYNLKNMDEFFDKLFKDFVDNMEIEEENKNSIHNSEGESQEV